MKIGCIIIHTESCTERKKYTDNLVSFFKDHVEVIVIPGVISDQVLHNAKYEKGTILLKGEVGCALAHMNAYKEAIDREFDYAFIFEDDTEIIIENYSKLFDIIQNAPVFDVFLLTHVFCFGYNTKIDTTFQYSSLPFGTQGYYISNEIVKNFYEEQVSQIKKGKLYIADWLYANYKKEKGVPLKLLTTIKNDYLFKHADIKSLIR